MLSTQMDLHNPLKQIDEAWFSQYGQLHHSPHVKINLLDWFKNGSINYSLLCSSLSV